jgi:oligopeptidase A
LSQQQQRILDVQLRDADISGVSLTGEARLRFNRLQEELTVLSRHFGQHVLDATKQLKFVVTDPQQVAGLSVALLAQGARLAGASGHAQATATAGPYELIGQCRHRV